MKIKHLALASLAILGFASCSNNDVDSSIEATSPQGDAYASFSINLGAESSTRAVTTDTDAGDISEQAINSVRVVLYANNIAAHAIDYTVSGTGEDIPSGEGVSQNPTRPNTPDQFTTIAQKVQKQNYEVAVFVNPSQGVINATGIGMPLQNLMRVRDKESNTSLQANGFLMSNEQGLIQLRADQLYEDDKLAEANPIPVKVDRALAKVIVESKLKADDNFNATVAIKDWTLDITNKKMFYLRGLNRLANNSLFDGGAMETPNDGSLRKRRYALDPNYDLGNLKDMSYDEKVKLLRPEFNYYNKPVFDAPKTAVGGIEYALENTIAHGENSAVKSQATRVILRASYQPKALGTEATDWYSYAGVPMTPETFKEKYTQALKGEWSEIIDELVPSFTNEIKNTVFFTAFIKNAQNKRGVDLTEDELPYFESNKQTLLAKYAPLMVVNMSDAALKGINDAIAAAKETATPGQIVNVKLDQTVIDGISFKDEAFAVGQLKFYKGGDNYYYLYVKHFSHINQASKPHQYGRYGVVRNNVYKVNVTKLLRPGEPTITPPMTGQPSVPTEPVDPENPKPLEPTEPEEPIDGQELYVAYEVEILPWFIREQDYEVK